MRPRKITLTSGFSREKELVRNLRKLDCWVETSQALNSREKIDFTVCQIGALWLDPHIQAQVTFRDSVISKATEFFSLADKRMEGISSYIEMPNMDSIRLAYLIKHILINTHQVALRLEEPYFWIKIYSNGSWHWWEGLTKIRSHLNDLRLAHNQILRQDDQENLGITFSDHT